MQITKTLGDGLDMLGFLLSKPDEAGHWTPAELIAYLNAAQKDIVGKIPSPILGSTLANSQTWASMGAVGTEYVAMPSTYLKFLSGYRFILSGDTETQKRLMVRKTVEFINSMKINVNYSSLMIRSAYISEFGSMFYVYPSSIASEAMRIFFVRTPIALTAETTYFSVIDDVYEVVLYYAAFLACLKDKQERAGDFLTTANNKIVELNAIHGVEMPLLTPQPK